jgi:hypothetical protein
MGSWRWVCCFLTTKLIITLNFCHSLVIRRDQQATIQCYEIKSSVDGTRRHDTILHVMMMKLANIVTGMMQVTSSISSGALLRRAGSWRSL